MTITAIVLFILLGIVLILIEFLVIPGVTVAGIFGTLLIIGGVFAGYYYHEAPYNHYLLAGSVVALTILFIFAFNSKTWKKFGLRSEIDSKVGQVDEEKIKIGDAGKTISRLAPIGKAMINEEVFEVRSFGHVIDQNNEITVAKIDGNKIYVELISN